MENDFIRKSRLFENLVAKEEIARELGLSTKTIGNWMSSGKLPSIRIGRKNFSLRSLLERWLEEYRINQG